jgi:hypothetical protein
LNAEEAYIHIDDLPETQGGFLKLHKQSLVLKNSISVWAGTKISTANRCVIFVP